MKKRRSFTPHTLRLETLESRRLLAGDLDITPADIAHDAAEGEHTAAERDLVAFARALADAGVIFYGADWCPHCTAQKEAFEEGQRFLPFVEVTNADRSINEVGQQAGISSFPTWVFPDGTRLEGQQTLETLSQTANIPIPTGTAPSFAPIDDVTVLSGSPLHIALDGYDPNGGSITYTVSSSDPSIVEPTLTSGNRSLLLETNFGHIVIELFEGRVPRATQQIIDLANNDIYDNTIFHRVIDGFMIQGGDPTGTGFGDPSIMTIDDQFHPDLQHNRDDLASFAKSADDTNSSQFFLTEGATRHLDFNHSIFGMIIEGSDVRQAISRIPIDSSDRPTPFTANLEQATVFTDDLNGVLMLRGLANGQADITVTATDSDGHQTMQTFRVDVEQDPINGTPYLSDISDLTISENTTTTITLEATDVDGNDIQFGVFPNSNVTFSFSERVVSPVNNIATTTLEITPNNGFTGTTDIEVFVVDPSNDFNPSTVSSSQVSGVADVQSIETNVTTPGTVSGIVFLDTDRDGTQNGGETGVSGFTVFSDANDNGVLDQGEIFTTSGSGGSYSLSLAPGDHTIRHDLEPHFLQTTQNPATITVVSSQDSPDVDFGTFQVAPVTVELNANSDTGFNPNDLVTNRNNSSSAATLLFDISGVVPGALVELFANGQKFGEATAANSIVQIETDGSSSLSDGVVQFTATQTFESTTSAVADNVEVTIDTTIEPFTSTPPTTVSATIDAQIDIDQPEEGQSGFMYSLDAAPTGATINADTGIISWIPTIDAIGNSESFTVRATDRAGNEITDTFSVDVEILFEARDNNFTFPEDSGSQTLSVLDNDLREPAGSTLTIVSVSDPTDGGTVSISGDGQSLQYESVPNFVGIERLTYTIEDGDTGRTSTAEVTVVITSVNDDPSATNDEVTVNKDSGATNLSPLDNDSILPDANETLTISAVGTPDNGGTVTINSDGITLDYEPAPGFSGTETFTYTIDDGNGGSAEATVIATVRDFSPSSLSGTVYVDANRNGMHDAGEDPIGGVPIMLSGTALGDDVNITATTNSDGSYEFSNLAPGTYTLSQSQPRFLIDGADSIGSQGGITGSDMFMITLEEDTQGTGNNFAELGREARTISLMDVLSSTFNTGIVSATVGGSSPAWYIPQGQWKSVEVTGLSYSSQTHAGTVQIQNAESTVQTAPLGSSNHVQAYQDSDGASLLRLSDFDQFHFQPVSNGGAEGEGEALGFDPIEDEAEGEFAEPTLEAPALTLSWQHVDAVMANDDVYEAESDEPLESDVDSFEDAVDAVLQSGL